MHYAKYFSSKTRSVSEAARDYLYGLFQSSKSNIEKMSEAASGLAQDAMPIDWEAINRACSLTARVLRKREKSAGVQRQWNGRHGKVDNCQVGAFEAIAKGEIAALIDARLYLPQSWIDEPARCDEAGIPKDQQAHRSKGELAADIVRTARQNGLRFGFVGLDGKFGQLPWLLRDLADTGGKPSWRMCIAIKSFMRKIPVPTFRPGKARVVAHRVV